MISRGAPYASAHGRLFFMPSPPELEAIDASIRGGNIPEARRLIENLVRADLSREAKLRLASLALRSDLPELGVEILLPTVRPPARSAVRATGEEIAEYAACLTRLGATEEAQHLLDPLDPGSYPRIHFYRYLALIAQWEYEKGIPHLEAYLSTLQLGDYQRVVAEVNLVAALVSERRHADAERVLATILEETGSKRYQLLRANALGLALSNAVLQSKWSEAKSFLVQARATLPAGPSIDELLLRKWGAFLGLMRDGAQPSHVRAVRAIKEEGTRRGHWETARDCDRALGIATNDEKLIVHLWFGTPFPSFRKWLLRGFGHPVSLPSRYVWKLGGEGAIRFRLSLSSADPSRSEVRPDLNKIPFKLLRILASDFYRPLRLPTLHHLLFPKEFYNPASSPLRVHQALNRLRRWLERSEAPLLVSHQDGLYRMEASAPCAIFLDCPSESTLGLAPLDALRQQLKAGDFPLSQAAKILSLSERSALRVVQKGIEEGSVERLGAGRKVRYRFSRK